MTFPLSSQFTQVGRITLGKLALVARWQALENYHFLFLGVTLAKEYDDMSPAERKAVRNSEWDRLKSGKKKSKSKDKDKK